jgi:hypothetical protein
MEALGGDLAERRAAFTLRRGGAGLSTKQQQAHPRPPAPSQRPAANGKRQKNAPQSAPAGGMSSLLS